MLVERAGSTHDQVALIPEPLMKRIYMETRSIAEEELETYGALLSMSRDEQGRWLDVKGRSLGTAAGQPVLPQAFLVPKVVLSPGLNLRWTQEGRKSEGQQLQKLESLAFIAILQGLAGANAVKVVMRYSTDVLGNAMLHELMNGYSVVFSGVFLKSEEERRCGSNVLWQQVETYDQLLQMRKSNEGLVGTSDPSDVGKMYKIGIVC